MNCPHCARVLYSRQRETCGYCGGILPPECRLPAAEVEKLQAEARAIEAKRKVTKAKEEEERVQQAKRAGDSYFPPLG